MNPLFLLQCDLYLKRLIQSRHRLKDNLIMWVVGEITHAVAQLVEALRYKPEDREFVSR
jgi:hypothetical protein